MGLLGEFNGDAVVVIVRDLHLVLGTEDCILYVGEAAGEVVGEVEVEIIQGNTTCDLHGTIGVHHHVMEERLLLVFHVQAGNVVLDQGLTDNLTVEVLGVLVGAGVDVCVHCVFLSFLG